MNARRPRWPAPIIAVVALTCGLVDAAAAQSRPHRPLTGIVVAGDGMPVAGAVVRAGTRDVLTSADGRFRVGVDADSVDVTVGRLGYAERRQRVAAGDSGIVIRLEAAPLALTRLLVAGERAATSSSARTARALDLALRPHASTQQLLAVAPGLVIAQHAGGGKAEQLFLRGFDADHGTDVAVSVDGTPINLVSHAHGHGYADLHFLIPALVERIDVRKGTYDPRDGDLATAGAVTLRTVDRVDGLSFTASIASFGERGASVALPFGGGPLDAGGYIAAAAARSDGPFEIGQDLQRTNLFARYTAPIGKDTRIRATFSRYDARWDASGQIPQRVVDRGEVGRFGAIDPTEGGRTTRHEASIAAAGGGAAQWSARAWLVRYELDLYSNFTFFLSDTVRGDGIVQRDRRTVAGAESRLTRNGTIGQLDAVHSAGVGVRADFASLLLGRQQERVQHEVITDARVRPLHLFAWVGEDVRIREGLHASAGLRADAFQFAVRESDLRAMQWTSLVSPKLALRYDVGRAGQLFASVGAGFHSNDARAVLSRPRTLPLVPRAIGAELGARRMFERGYVAGTVWALDLESELVYVGDAGTSEPSGRSRRTGVDLEARLQLLTWLWADADLNLARGRMRDQPAGRNRIPLAPSRTAAAGLTVRDAGPISAALRIRHVASRPADEEGLITARGHTLADANAGVEVGRFELRVALENALDASWNEAQFATTSRLRAESLPVTELHFTPGAPRVLRIETRVRFL